MVLSRNELIGLFKSDELIIDSPDKAFEKCADLDYSKDNLFQQCSIDIRIGYIYIPETEPNEVGGACNPKFDEHVLKTGQTVMIRTKEKITVPDNIGAICFSPSRLALKAVLITNMGHVDPGYSGHLHFTAINMGKEPYTFRGNDIICSMVLFKLSEHVPAFGDEFFNSINTASNTVKVPAVITNYFPKLARDFVDVDKRARSIALDEINKTKIWQIGVPIISAVIMLCATVIQLWINKPWEKELYQLTSRFESMEKKLNYDERIKQLENKFDKHHK